MRILPFDKGFGGRETFCCGKKPLDDYLRQYVSQDISRNLVATFVLINGENEIKGYYTLSSASIPKVEVPVDYQRKVGIYKDIPVTLLGRLGVDQSLKGQGFGKILLVDALKRAYEVSQKLIGSVAVIVDPIDEDASNFYESFGFLALETGKMFLPMGTLSSLFGK